jgi:hypothetical protein
MSFSHQDLSYCKISQESLQVVIIGGVLPQSDVPSSYILLLLHSRRTKLPNNMAYAIEIVCKLLDGRLH